MELQRIASVDPNWFLTIWGEYPERKSLEALIHRLGLDGRAQPCR